MVAGSRRRGTRTTADHNHLKNIGTIFTFFSRLSVRITNHNLNMPISISKHQAYWFSQIFGWGVFVLYEIVNLLGLGFFSWNNALFMFLAALLGIGITHVYRTILIRIQVFEMPFTQMAVLAFLAVFALSIVLFAGLSVVTWVIETEVNWEQLTLNYMFMSVLNWSRYLFVWVLIYHLHGLMERINRTQVERLASENQLKNVELQNLKAQLNPHFLFNALNSVKALTHSDPQRAGEAVMLLSDLLRYSLNYEKQSLVPLSDELAVTRDYLALEKIRFNRRLEYHLEIEPAAEKWPIPPILLVTLAENAIKHGIAQSIQGGFVHIKAHVENGHMKLEVCNTGHFSPDPNRQGIGLANIQRRLEMLFSGKAVFNLNNNLEQNTVTAAVQIPAT